MIILMYFRSLTLQNLSPAAKRASLHIHRDQGGNNVETILLYDCFCVLSKQRSRRGSGDAD